MTDESVKAEHRRIRSFVRREGRLTPGQEKALREYWPVYGLDLPAATEQLRAWLAGPRPVTLEIGFGNGESLAEMAANAPERRFIGIEVHRPGVGRLLQAAHDRGLENLRVIVADAVEVLNACIPDASLDTVQLFFPDPWPKKRHHKRRIVRPAFIGLIAQKLKPGGLIHMATDWAPYAEHMLECMEQSSDFVNTAGPGAYAPRPAHRPLTKFERRGERLGHGVWDLIHQRR